MLFSAIINSPYSVTSATLSSAAVINVAVSEALVSTTFSVLPAEWGYNMRRYFTVKTKGKIYSFLNLISNLSMKGQVAR